MSPSSSSSEIGDQAYVGGSVVDDGVAVACKIVHVGAIGEGDLDDEVAASSDDEREHGSVLPETVATYAWVTVPLQDLPLGTVERVDGAACQETFGLLLEEDVPEALRRVGVPALARVRRLADGTTVCIPYPAALQPLRYEVVAGGPGCPGTVRVHARSTGCEGADTPQFLEYVETYNEATAVSSSSVYVKARMPVDCELHAGAGFRVVPAKGVTVGLDGHVATVDPAGDPGSHDLAVDLLAAQYVVVRERTQCFCEYRDRGFGDEEDDMEPPECEHSLKPGDVFVVKRQPVKFRTLTSEAGGAGAGGPSVRVIPMELPTPKSGQTVYCVGGGRLAHSHVGAVAVPVA